jgi:hypothetical protein
MQKMESLLSGYDFFGVFVIGIPGNRGKYMGQQMKSSKSGYQDGLPATLVCGASGLIVRAA